jgi:nicotine blue oxidoreductase
VTTAAAGVLLAAGAGSRFGGPKALASLGGEPLLARAARTLLAAGCRPVVVVLGAAASEVRRTVDLSGVEVTVNDGWEQGISTSLRAGLEALRGRAPAAVVALADQPLVTPEVVRRLVAAWRPGGAEAVVACYGGAWQNPVLFDASVWDEVAASVHGDEGAKVWLRANPERVVGVECGDAGSAADVDLPGDLRRVGERAARGGLGPDAEGW